MSINVLYVTNHRTFHGGAPRSLYEILTNLDRTKVSPFVAYTAEGDFIASLRRIGIPSVRILQFHGHNPHHLLYSTARLIGFIRKHRINVIHNNQCCDAYTSWLAGKLTHTPIVIHHRDPSIFRFGRFLIEHVECNIAISTWYNQHMLRGKGVVILNGIDLRRFPGRSTSRTGENVKVSVVGRIDPKKGLHVFLEAARKIASKRFPSMEFEIVGDWSTQYYQDYKCQLRELVKKYGIHDRVSLRDWCDDIEEVYSQADICVVPSIRESFGRVVLEAMACYKPVIATNIGGALDAITEETGILVPVEDPDRMADAIVYLAERPQLREQMGIAGRKRVEQYFTIQRTVEGICQVYARLLDRCPGR